MPYGDWGTYENMNVHPKEGDVSNDPNYNEQFANYKQRYPYLTYSPNVQDRTGDSPLMAEMRGMESKVTLPPYMPDQTNSPISNAMGGQTINDWTAHPENMPANWANRWASQYQMMPPGISEKTDLIGKMYIPMQEHAAALRHQQHLSTPAGTSPVYDESLLHTLRALRDTK